MSLLHSAFFGRLGKCSALLSNKVMAVTYSPSRFIVLSYDELKKPRPRPGDPGSCFRRKVHFPKEYTVEPLKVTHLGGRDPNTGRKIVEGIGGGYKFKYHWIQWLRDGPESGPPTVERVIQIIEDGNRTARVALVARGDELKYYLATTNMKPGQLLTTSREIPKNPVVPVEGNAHPLGSLPVGTSVNNIERIPGKGSMYVHAAGTSAKIIKQLENTTVVKMPSKHEFTFDRHCLAVVGRLSNHTHNKEKYTSMTEWKIDGNRPRSGLYKKKTGRFGRKLRKPLQVTVAHRPRKPKPYQLSFPGMP